METSDLKIKLRTVPFTIAPKQQNTKELTEQKKYMTGLRKLQILFERN